MYPDAPQNQSTGAANLPPVAPQPQLNQAAQSAAPVPMPPASAVSPADQAALKAKQLVMQYGQNPFQLSEALSQLKSGYLAEHYHINPNVAED